MHTDTIAAISTAPGQGGIAIVRVSGERAGEILRRAFVPAREGAKMTSHRLRYGLVEGEDGEILDEVMAVFMAAPNTYTRQDVAEIHCHGGDACAARVLSRVLELGARPAEPGEFTRRAFENGRIDLSRAEAVMQLISARGEGARRASLRQMNGGVALFVLGIVERIEEALATIEASVDFPDEVDEDVLAGVLCAELESIAAQISAKIDPDAARVLREGASVVITGRPNVGKSSLMNALLGAERAIVTDVPGTTRDAISERMELHGRVVQLTDTAGVRKSGDVIEQIGVHLARKAVQSADVVLLVLDASQPLEDEDRHLLALCDARYILCLNKCDLEARVDEDELPPRERVRLSAATGQGVEEVKQRLAARLRAEGSEEEILTVQRHLTLAREALSHIEACVEALKRGYCVDVTSDDLWEACRLLNRITGRDAAEEVIDKIFANFCVGK